MPAVGAALRRPLPGYRSGPHSLPRGIALRVSWIWAGAATAPLQDTRFLFFVKHHFCSLSDNKISVDV